jgi:hypothetical protein
MDARRIRTAALAVTLLWGAVSHGASVRTPNFVITTQNPHIAQRGAQLAEQYRRQLAIDWLGRELPPWPQPCPVTMHVGTNLGPGGATSFCFRNGQPFNWTMTIQGPPDRLLDSVLPHEVLHTIFATHFGRPLPRWADEGACTTIEHPSETTKYHQHLIEALTTGRGIPFNRMFAMMEYPSDVLPLYAQGHSLARYLIAMGGRKRYVQFVGDGMRSNNWPAVAKKHYGFDNLSDLQVTWNQWVAKGSPSMPGQDAPGLEPIGPGASDQLLAAGRGRTPNGASAALASAGAGRPSSVALASYNRPAEPMKAAAGHDGWYSRTRRGALAARQQQALTQTGGQPRSMIGGPRPVTNVAALPGGYVTRPQQPQTSGQINLNGGYPVPPGQLQPIPGNAFPTVGGVPTAPITVPSQRLPATRIMQTIPAAGTVYPMAPPISMAMPPAYLGSVCVGST